MSDKQKQNLLITSYEKYVGQSHCYEKVGDICNTDQLTSNGRNDLDVRCYSIDADSSI